MKTSEVDEFDPFETIRRAAEALPPEQDFALLRACWHAARANERGEFTVDDEETEQMILFLDLVETAGLVILGRGVLP